MNESRPKRPVHVGTVSRIERLAGQMVRVELGGEGLAGFEAGRFTDHYVKVRFPPANGETDRIPTRSLTVRRWDPASRRLTLDALHHGEVGLLGPWLSALRAGDEVSLLGPGGSYAPDPASAWHLLIGDGSVIPAIAAALERIPADARVVALIEVGGPGDEIPLECAGRLDLCWLHRDPAAGPERSPLIAAVRDLRFSAGDPQVFLHGEATVVRELIRHLVVDRGLDRGGMSASGYWKYRHTDESWRAFKPQWKRQVEADTSAA